MILLKNPSIEPIRHSEPFGPERASRTGSAKGKNLMFSQT